jgi:protein SCO1/2
LRGHPLALFFGFTHCPDKCPTTLAHLAKAVRSAGVPRDVRVAFITVDPQRDSPAALKRYVRLFDPNFIGLTGLSNELNPVYDAYHTLRRAAPQNGQPGDEAFEHGTAVYYIGREGAIKGVGQFDDSPAEMIRNFMVSMMPFGAEVAIIAALVTMSGRNNVRATFEELVRIQSAGRGDCDRASGSRCR